MHFKDYLLEEMTPRTQQETQTAGVSEEASSRIPETFIGKKNDTSGRCDIRYLLAKFVIEKYKTNTHNLFQWMSVFEGESSRLGIKEDVERIQIIRFFL